MKIKKLKSISYSPTGTSRKIVHAIKEGCKREHHEAEDIDMTYPDQLQNIVVEENELAIIGVPVYAGRVAPIARTRLRSITGSNSPAIAVILYGNREFEDALIELRDILLEQSFTMVACCAFIGEHSFSSVQQPIAQDRPDERDLEVAKDFGNQIMTSIDSITPSLTEQIQVPGMFPYKEGVMKFPFSPHIDHQSCTECQLCLSTCPVGAITHTDQISITISACTFCCACIKTCPENAVSIQAAPILEKVQWLHANCQERKEPQLFL